MDESNKDYTFLQFEHSTAAISAIKVLHDKAIMDGASRLLIVKFAYSRLQKQTKQRHRGQGSSFYHVPFFSMYRNKQQQPGPYIGVPQPL
jgi:DNA relaxase NicK